MFDEEAIPTDEAVAATSESGAPQEQASPGVESAGVGDGTPSFGGGVPMPRARPKVGAMSNIANIASAPSEDLQTPDNPRGNHVKALVSYLMGADAAHPQELEASSQGADPSGQLPASARNVLAVQQAAGGEGGPDAAWKLVQGHRVAFNAKQAFGYAALNGTAGKPPDIEAAIDAANKAQSHVLDGSEVRFTRSPQGVTATVISPEGQPQHIPLSPDQFRAYMNVGGEGQFDKLMQNGIPAAIQRLASQDTASRVNRQLPQRPQAQAPQQQGEAIATGVRPEGESANSESSTAAPDPKSQASKTSAAEAGPGYSRQLEERASRIFPWISQAQQKEAWLAQQSAREDENENKLNIAKEGVYGRVSAAGVRGDSTVRAQELKNEGGANIQEIKNKGWQYASEQKRAGVEAKIAAEANKLASSNANQAQTRALRVIQEKLRTLQTLTPQEQAIVDRFNTDANAQAPALQGQPQQQAAPQQAPQKTGGKPDRAALEAEMRRRGLL